MANNLISAISFGFKLNSNLNFVTSAFSVCRACVSYFFLFSTGAPLVESILCGKPLPYTANLVNI